jgi:hypothetical protein
VSLAPLLAWLKNRSRTAQTSERQLLSPGKRAHHFRAPADLAERPFEEIGRPPPFAVSEWIAQMHDQRVEVLGQAAGGRLVAAVLEL